MGGPELRKADREKAEALVRELAAHYGLGVVVDLEWGVRLIAQCLAAARAEARAPFLALADEYERSIPWRGSGIHNRIRRAAQDQQ
jgi:hypothetical protein